MEYQKVPLNAGWLSENDLLLKSAKMINLDVNRKDATKTGIFAYDLANGKQTFIQWTDDMMFTIAQLIELGFDLGTLDYCPDCKRLLADCKREQNNIAEAQQAELT